MFGKANKDINEYLVEYTVKAKDGSTITAKRCYVATSAEDARKQFLKDKALHEHLQSRLNCEFEEIDKVILSAQVCK